MVNIVASAYFLFLGTFFPARRASESPMAIACLRLLTLRRERPLRSVPRFISCIARRTFLPAALLYLRAIFLSSCQWHCCPRMQANLRTVGTL
jgi:hypothetical protein